LARTTPISRYPGAEYRSARTLIRYMGVQRDEAGSGFLGPRLNSLHQGPADAAALPSRSDGQLLYVHIESRREVLPRVRVPRKPCVNKPNNRAVDNRDEDGPFLISHSGFVTSSDGFLIRNLAEGRLSIYDLRCNLKEQSRDRWDVLKVGSADDRVHSSSLDIAGSHGPCGSDTRRR
jgi:hypothetical protein